MNFTKVVFGPPTMLFDLRRHKKKTKKDEKLRRAKLWSEGDRKVKVKNGISLEIFANSPKIFMSCLVLSDPSSDPLENVKGQSTGIEGNLKISLRNEI